MIGCARSVTSGFPSFVSGPLVLPLGGANAVDFGSGPTFPLGPRLLLPWPLSGTRAETGGSLLAMLHQLNPPGSAHKIGREARCVATPFYARVPLKGGAQRARRRPLLARILSEKNEISSEISLHSEMGCIPSE